MPFQDSHSNSSNAGWPISVQRLGRGTGVYYTAECQVCSYAHNVSVNNSDQIAQAAALEAVRRHVRSKHPERAPM